MLAHEHVCLGALVVLVVGILASFLGPRNGLRVLNPDDLIVDQANAVIYIVVLVVRIRHIISLHVENKYVMPEEASLAIQHIVHLGLILQSLQQYLLISHRWKTEIFYDFSPRTVAVSTINVQKLCLVGDGIGHVYLLPVILVGVVLQGESLFDLEHVILVKSYYEEVLY